MSGLGDSLEGLSPAKRILADLLIAERRGGPGALARDLTAEPLPPTGAEDRYAPFPLTDLQLAYWLGRQGGIELGSVGNHGYAELSCVDLDLGRLAAAWRRLVERHEMLRAVLLPDGQQQILAAVPAYDIAEIDLRALPARETGLCLAETRERMSHPTRPGDRWPLFELLAFRLDERRILLCISIDLLMCDLESLDILFGELIQLYDDPAAALPALSLSFRDFVLAGAALRDSAGYRRAEDYWRERVATLPLAPALPTARQPSAISNPKFHRRSARFSREAWEELKARSAREGLTPTALLIAAFAEVLAAWSESPRFTLNLPIANRPPLHPQIKEVVGSFSSFLLLEVDCSASEPFLTRAQRVQKQLWRDLENAEGCGVWLLRELVRHHRRAPGGLMPVVFTSTLGIARGSTFASLDRLGETVYEVTQTPQVWLDYLLYEQAGELHLDWDAVDEIFPPGLLDGMFAAHRDLLARLAAGEEAWGAPVRSLAPAEQLALRATMNDTAAPVPEVRLEELFNRQAMERPEAVAVVSGGMTLSYAELARSAGSLAVRLRERGARPDHPVGVVMEKGWEQVVGVLAVLAAGAPYLPLDPAWPRERLWSLLNDAGVEVALTQPRLATGLSWPPGLAVLAVETLPPPAAEAPVPPPGSPRDLAYVIFTSGSTGRPKGVQIEHRGVVNRVLDVNARFGIGAGDRVLAVTSLQHDLSVYDLFGTLAAGGTMVLPEPAGRPDPERWIELARQRRVTVWNSVPALFEMFLDCREAAGGAVAPPPLRQALLSGDWIPVGLPDRALSLLPGLRVIGLGGPTETTVWDICFPIAAVDPEWRSIPYGRPMANASYHVLDAHLAPRPCWAAGDLYIGGAGLARGYWRDEEATGASFVVHPGTGERLYRSGDRGRYLPDGAIEMLGREDFQVKVQGQRIELGEIEVLLARHPGVESAVVTLSAGDRLVAHVVPAAGVETVREAAERLARKLGEPAARPAPGGDFIPLARPDLDETELARYVERRSYRRFTPEPVRLADLGAWLSCLRQLEIEGVPIPKYRYPSGGGLYPVQAYLHVKPGRLEGVEPGAYYYHPREHRLVLLADALPLTARSHLEVNRAAFAECAFSLFLIAQLKAIEPVYGEAAREFCFLEAGYMSQLLMAEAPRRGIGLCPVGQLEFDPLRPGFALEESHLLLHTLLGGGIAAEQRTGAAIAAELAPLPGSALTLPAELRVYLRERLPAHLVPADVEVLDALPLTPNGKVDRDALARRAPRRPPPSPDDEPRGDLEKLVAEVWRETLGVERVGVHDNFFDLGGNSLHLIQIYRRLKSRAPELSTRELFRQPTIHALARHLGREEPLAGRPAASASRAELRRSLRRGRNDR